MAELRMVVWNVKAGNAITFITPNSKRILFDMGASADCSPLDTMKEWSNGRVIDSLVVTHPHADHLRDIGKLKQLGIRVGSLLRPEHLTEQEVKDANGSDDAECIDAYLELHKRYTSTVKCEESVLSHSNNGGVYVKHYHPQMSSHTNINNHSIVTFVGFEGTKILLPGDCEGPGWNELLDDDGFKSDLKGVNILVASHHGHESGYSEKVMSYIKGSLTLVIVSDGKFQEEVSVTSYYSNASSGCEVSCKKWVTQKVVKCLTTRTNGWIDITISRNRLSVKVEK